MRIPALMLLGILALLAAEGPPLERITLGDGRVLEGKVDEDAGTIQLWNLKTGKPLAVLPIKVADITAREPIDLAKPADDADKEEGQVTKPKVKRGADGRFLTNHQAALKLAKELNRPVFAFFTGSDWCPACKGMQKEVLTTPEFRAWAERSVVMLELDYPNKALAKAIKDQNEALQRQYGISSYPTVHLINPADGKSFGSLVSYFKDGGPGVYIDELIKRIPAAKLSK